MQITAYRRQFLSDHSSTSYLFYSPKRLSKEARAFVSTLSSHVDVSAHTAAITYHGDFADLGHDRRLKFLRHFPVSVRESYDWWDMVVVLDNAKVAALKLPERYSDCEGESSLSFSEQDDSLILWFEGTHLNYGAFKSSEALTELCIDIRDEIHGGTLDAVDVMANYCVGEPELEGRELSPAAQELDGLLAPI